MASRATRRPFSQELKQELGKLSVTSIPFSCMQILTLSCQRLLLQLPVYWPLTSHHALVLFHRVSLCWNLLDSNWMPRDLVAIFFLNKLLSVNCLVLDSFLPFWVMTLPFLLMIELWWNWLLYFCIRLLCQVGMIQLPLRLTFVFQLIARLSLNADRVNVRRWKVGPVIFLTLRWLP